MNRKQKRQLVRILITVLCMISALLFLPDGFPRDLLFLAVYLLIGYDILKKALTGLVNRQIFDESFLMAVATVGALILGEYMEAVAVMLFFQMGELFEGIAVGKSRKSIAALMDIRPDSANVLQENGELLSCSPDEVEPGSEIVVLPGERVPVDCVILSGESCLDCSALTGESMPRDVKEGDEVLSGSVNLKGRLHLRTTKRFEESTVSRILELVENASGRKSHSESFISRFAQVYTPLVCLAAFLLGVLPPIISLLLGLEAQWQSWIYRALSFLVISCPCALVISIPLGFFAGIGGAGKAGILIKGSNYLERLAQVGCVVYDKTGTLTQGHFQVTKVQPCGISEAEVLELAALGESASHHPIALSILNAYGKEPDTSRLGSVTEDGGYGILAVIDGREVALGNARLMEKLGIDYPQSEDAGTRVYLAREGTYLGCLILSDTLKHGAVEALSRLRTLGVKKQVLLTGDREETAASVATELGIDQYHAELLPQDKVSRVEALLEQLPKSQTLAFVGDGINDAPVLSRADVGIAMGALGSDAAIEAADVVLMDDDPGKLALAVGISRKCLRIVRQNILFAIGVKLLFLLLTALGLSNMWFAIFADVGVMVLAVLNAMRTLNVSRL